MQPKDENIEVVNSTKLLGTIIADDLKLDLNTKNFVGKANARMALLRKVASIRPPIEDLKTIHVLFIRESSILPCLQASHVRAGSKSMLVQHI